MTSPTTARLDLYATIHKAYRAFYGDTLHRLGRIDLDDAQDCAQALGQTRALLRQMRHHIHHEDGFVHPALQAAGHQPDSLSEHAAHADEIAALEQQVERLQQAPRAQRDALAHALYHRLALLVADNLEHMHREETDNNAVLWARYEDVELAALHERLVASIEPPVLMEIMGWMVPALTPRELAEVMAGVRTSAPPPAFQALLDLARDKLEPVRWQKLQRALRAQPEPATA